MLRLSALRVLAVLALSAWLATAWSVREAQPPQPRLRIPLDGVSVFSNRDGEEALGVFGRDELGLVDTATGELRWILKTHLEEIIEGAAATSNWIP